MLKIGNTPQSGVGRKTVGRRPDCCFRKKASFMQVGRKSQTAVCQESLKETEGLRPLETGAPGKWNVCVFVICKAQRGRGGAGGDGAQ